MDLDYYVIIGIALGLALDAFAVAIGTSICLGKVSWRQTFRLGWHFGLFQALMPVLGWIAGLTVADLIRAWDHWVAFALLITIGGKAVYEALQKKEDACPTFDPTKGWSLVILSVATSIDALAVGLSFAALDVRIWAPAVVIGIVAAALTTVGMLAGARLGARFGRRMEAVGGLVLIGIGIKIVVEHLSP